MSLEPCDEVIDTRMNFPPISVTIGSQRKVFYDGFYSWLVSEGKFSRSLLGGTEEVGYSFWVLFSFV